MDVDKEGLSNLREYLAGTHPRVVSTDGDLYSDYEELAYGSDPLVAASIPPVRVEFSNAGPSLLKVSTFRAERSVGGEAVTVVGAPDTQFFSTAPGGVLTPGEITVTTDAVQHFATVWVFAPKGVAGGRNETVTTEDNLTGNGNGNGNGNSQTGNSHTLSSYQWRGNLGLSLNPTMPGPSPESAAPPEGLVFTAHRKRKLSYSGRQLVSPATEEYGAPSPIGHQWLKPAGGVPAYSDDGFNGDADPLGNNDDPGDPRDGITSATGALVPASPDEPGAHQVETGGARSVRIIGPYGTPTGLIGTYTATNAYSPPDTIESNGDGGFNPGQAVGKLEGVSYFQGASTNGWQGNGVGGVASYTVASTWSTATEQAPTVTYTNPETGDTGTSAATYQTQGASMEQVEVRLQTNKEVVEGRPQSAEFMLTKTTVAGGSTTTELLATVRLSINVGKVSDSVELLSGTLPAEVTQQGGVVSMRSPPPLTGQESSYALLPVEVVSRDKFLAGSFDIPAGWDNLAMEFIGPDGENLGKYGSLLGGGPTKIYDTVTDILSEADVAAGSQPASQKVWFVRDGVGSRKICYYTCFNSVGQAQIKLYPEESEAESVTVTHDLVAAQDFAGTIAYVDAWVKGTSFNWSVPYQALSGPVLALASQAASDPSAAGLSSTAIAGSLVSGAVITADTSVPVGTDAVDLALGQPLAGTPALGGQTALQILPLNAIQLQNPLSLEPGTVYWLAGGVLHPLAEEQVTELGEQAGSLTLAAPPPSSSPPPSENEEGGSSGNNGGIDNLTRAALIPFFNVINQVEGVGSIVVGLCDGVKSGVQDDWAFIELIALGGAQAGTWAYESAKAELNAWKTDPVKRAAELKVVADQLCVDWVYKPAAKFWVETGDGLWKEIQTERGFRHRTWQIYRAIKGALQTASTWTAPKDLWATMVEELCDWGDDFNVRMINGADKAHWEGVPWAKDNLLADFHSVNRYRCYSFGYTFGYVVEQVAVGLATDGVLKLAQVAAKGGVVLAANLAKRTAAAVVARGQWLKHLLAESGVGDAVLRAAYEKGMVACLVEPVGPTIKEAVFEVLEKAFSKEGFSKSIYSWKHLQDDILQRPNLAKLVKQAGGEAVFQRRLSQLATILGEEFDAMAARNFAKVADEIILIAKPDGTVDEFFESFFRAFEGNPSLMVSADVGATFSKNSLSAEGKATLKKFLSDPNAGKLWEIDVPAIVDNEPAVPHNYWIRGILAELSIYKRAYKDAGYLHAPTAAGFDFKSTLEYVQIKSLKNPDGAYGAMKKAVDALAALPSPPAGPPGLKLHILKKPGSGSDQLEMALRTYINNSDDEAVRGVQLLIQEFDLVP